jgi:hypothetical protein
VVVAVPEAELTDEHRRPTTDDGPPDNRRMINGAPLDYRPPPLENSGEFDDSSRRSVLSVTVGALRLAVDLLGQQLEAERRRAEAAQAQVEGLHRDLTAAEAAASEARRALDAARQEAAEAQASADVAQAAQGEAEADSAQLRAELEAAHRLVTTAQERAQAVERAEADWGGRRAARAGALGPAPGRLEGRIGGSPTDRGGGRGRFHHPGRAALRRRACPAQPGDVRRCAIACWRCLLWPGDRKDPC